MHHLVYLMYRSSPRQQPSFGPSFLRSSAIPDVMSIIYVAPLAGGGRAGGGGVGVGKLGGGALHWLILVNLDTPAVPLPTSSVMCQCCWLSNTGTRVGSGKRMRRVCTGTPVRGGQTVRLS
jgi:hypothetical protein